MKKKYDFQDRLVSFAGDMILFVIKYRKKFAGEYLFDQILRSSGSAALNFAESQGSASKKDYLHRATIALKELKETEINLRIMKHIKFGGDERSKLQKENIELIKILRTIIKNKTASTPSSTSPST